MYSLAILHAVPVGKWRNRGEKGDTPWHDWSLLILIRLQFNLFFQTVEGQQSKIEPLQIANPVWSRIKPSVQVQGHAYTAEIKIVGKVSVKRSEEAPK